MASLNNYADGALTTLKPDPIPLQQDVPGTWAPAQTQGFIGSNDAGAVFEDKLNPGVDPILLGVIDTGTGGSQPASSVKLAGTQAGLATATPGAPLSLGTSIAAGPAGAKEWWAEWDDASGTLGTATNLRIGILSPLKVTL